MQCSILTKAFGRKVCTTSLVPDHNLPTTSAEHEITYQTHRTRDMQLDELTARSKGHRTNRHYTFWHMVLFRLEFSTSKQQPMPIQTIADTMFIHTILPLILKRPRLLITIRIVLCPER